MQFQVNTFRSDISSNTRRAAATLPARKCSLMAVFDWKTSPAACRCGGGGPRLQKRRRRRQRNGRRRFWMAPTIVLRRDPKGEIDAWPRPHAETPSGGGWGAVALPVRVRCGQRAPPGGRHGTPRESPVSSPPPAPPSIASPSRPPREDGGGTREGR